MELCTTSTWRQSRLLASCSEGFEFFFKVSVKDVNNQAVGAFSTSAPRGRLH